MLSILDMLFDGADGYTINTEAYAGNVEIFAWKMTSLHPSLLETGHVGVGVLNEQLSLPLIYSIEEMIVKVWVCLQIQLIMCLPIS